MPAPDLGFTRDQYLIAQVGYCWVVSQFEIWGADLRVKARHALLYAYGEAEVESMPRSLKGEKRPADVIGNTAHVMRITTRKIEENRSFRCPESKTVRIL